MSDTNAGGQTGGIFGDLYPYKNRFETHAQLSPKGKDAEEIYRQLAAIAAEEDQKWETGLVSGTMYHGGKEHYAFLNRAFSLFSLLHYPPPNLAGRRRTIYRRFTRRCGIRQTSAST